MLDLVNFRPSVPQTDSYYWQTEPGAPDSAPHTGFHMETMLASTWGSYRGPIGAYNGAYRGPISRKTEKLDFLKKICFLLHMAIQGVLT